MERLVLIWLLLPACVAHVGISKEQLRLLDGYTSAAPREVRLSTPQAQVLVVDANRSLTLMDRDGNALGRGAFLRIDIDALEFRGLRATSGDELLLPWAEVHYAETPLLSPARTALVVGGGAATIGAILLALAANHEAAILASGRVSAAEQDMGRRRVANQRTAGIAFLLSGAITALGGAAWGLEFESAP